MKRNRWPIIVSTAAALALLGAACGKGSSSSGNLSVSVSSAAASPTMGGSLDLGHGILVNEIRLAVVKVALESGQDAGDASDTTGMQAGAHAADQGGGGGGDHGGGDGGGQGESDEVKVGPCFVDLTGDKLGAGTDAVSPVCAADIPAGTYRELEVDIGPVAALAAAGVAGLSGMNGRSVIIDGSFNGTAFSFQSTLDVRQKTEATITVGASNNVTISLDLAGWFTAPGGGVLDPNVAGNQSAIEDNIRASIRSFEDDNRDDHQDGDRGGGSGGGM